VLGGLGMSKHTLGLQMQHEYQVWYPPFPKLAARLCHDCNNGFSQHSLRLHSAFRPICH
jgi:hypothetical protein